MLRIGNFSGYWGDDPEALARQLRGGRLDYLTGDYLAELTMAILERQRRADPRAGFARHFVDQLRGSLREVIESGVRIVVNAGGVNPEGCRDAVMKLFAEAGASIPIGVVTGSDVLASMPKDPSLLSAHAYLGARPIAEALASGARIVITGRVTDAALALGPMLHSLGWSDTDWDRLSAGTIAGHVLECGAQATGGVFTDFEAVPIGKERLGYPIVEMEEDGTFTVTKHEGSGGSVSIETVAEQLLYEIFDPRAYLTPDVTADFTSISLEQIGRDRVRISGARGTPPPPTVKVSCVHAAGHRAIAHVLISGPRLEAKAARIRELLAFPGDFDDARSDLIGEGRQAVLRFAVRDSDRAKVERFSRLLLGLWVQGPPGVTMLDRPHAEEAFAFRPAFLPREAVGLDPMPRFDPPDRQSRPPPRAELHAPLRELAHARCGDKGNRANIGVRARSEEAYAHLYHSLTAERVGERFGLSVVRYELPNLRAFNFVLEDALGGGGSVSLLPDPLGKTMADALLDMAI